MFENIWDQRYSIEKYVYGREPNDFLVSSADKIKGKKILCVAEGEGRNAVFLAQQGFDVTAVDSSAVGIGKAKKLAEEKGVKIKTIVSDLNDFEIVKNNWDAIISIYCHLPEPLRKRINLNSVKGLRKGGLLILEGFEKKQINNNTGGPKDEKLLFDINILKSEFKGLEFLISKETEREVWEGELHKGKANVVQILGIRQ